MNVGDLIQVKIDRLSYDGGRGVARFNNFVFFVANTAPGDEIEAKIISLKKNFGFAECLKIIKPSSARRAAPCPVFQRCGGCVWQNITYDEQLKQKQNIVLHALRKFLPTELLDTAIVPSPNEFRYRNRIQIQIRNKQFGFFAAGSNDLVQVNDCLIADERLFKKFLETKEKNLNSKKVEVAVDGSGHTSIRDLDTDESIFAQVNSAQNETLRATVLNYAAKSKAPTEIYDLYCGDGNFSFLFQSAKAKPESKSESKSTAEPKIVAVESSATAIERANKRLASVDQSRFSAEFVTADVEDYLIGLGHSSDSALFICDPPRAGLGRGVCEQILRLAPASVVYVSCNPITLARDLGDLAQKFTVSDLTILDMFPQTEHVETVVHLVPRASR